MSETLTMLSEAMNLWHGIVIAVVTLLLQTCLLTAINYLLSRRMVHQNEQILKGVRLQAPRPSPAPYYPPAAEEVKETQTERDPPVSDLRYRHDSDTSSDSSDSSNSSPPIRQAIKDVNYTQVVFSAPRGLKNDSARDYENTKETTDYVNVNPKSYTTNFWTFANPSVSEPVEYTQVAI
ncbi:regulator of hemoglobinization and erythroid cell expansion protein [Nycticebus coucang]|uniref:regulator of hemoglobinization and erythroid cell expansion protein n=1 Tax=Nycticebus coucang TaxID=9470 RepID=UPI00234D9D75|nr:regulator of hemoglobinization and erythroid cell expansion protein [Nycticebus coucang]